MRKRLSLIFLLTLISVGSAFGFEYHWQLDDTPEGSESATVIAPVQVILLDEVVHVPSHSASLTLMRKYSVHLTADWTPALAYRLLQTFESIPQRTNNPYTSESDNPASVWQLTTRHLHNDIDIEYRDEERIITIASEAFTYADPLLAEIDGVRGRYFSKRLHRAVVRFTTDDGADRRALKKILKERYAVSVNVPDYTELTRHTTGEHAGRFDDFKNEELIALVAMLEEYPTGMIKTQGLKYIVRRLDGTPHPTHTTAPAVAWTGAGYIEFMESAFKEQGLDYIHRLILHEKAHFLWAYLFDDQLKQDWIALGGWYEHPDDADGWSTTQQVEFVSAYAHAKNPDEDMAESISYYIVNPDKLRSRSPAKYAFIQNRIMHGTRYISKIREDLTFQVYNLYPDYVYPGRIVRVDIEVTGEPEQDKQITIEIELHSESELDKASGGYARIFSEKGTYVEVGFFPVNANGERVTTGHFLRSPPATLSRYAAAGYWGPDQISIKDLHGNRRHGGQNDFGWKLYIDNPLADYEPPQYVPNSIRLSLSDAQTEEGRPYQIVTAQWLILEKTGIKHVCASLNDDNDDTYSLFEYGYNRDITKGIVEFPIPPYMQSGNYELNRICMKDIANNTVNVYFTHKDHPTGVSGGRVVLDEPPPTIEIQTTNPDSTPPILDVNNITITAVPTKPEAPDGETKVDITFRVKDDISGYTLGSMRLRDPQGVKHHFWHYPGGGGSFFFIGDPTIYRTYYQTIILPVGSPPGTWGLAEMTLQDKARNFSRFDFTEIVRFEVTEETPYDLNADGEINILDLVIVANALGESNSEADLNSDGIVNILDLVLVANAL